MSCSDPRRDRRCCARGDSDPRDRAHYRSVREEATGPPAEDDEGGCGRQR